MIDGRRDSRLGEGFFAGEGTTFSSAVLLAVLVVVGAVFDAATGVDGEPSALLSLPTGLLSLPAGLLSLHFTVVASSSKLSKLASGFNEANLGLGFVDEPFLAEGDAAFEGDSTAAFDAAKFFAATAGLAVSLDCFGVAAVLIFGEEVDG